MGVWSRGWTRADAWHAVMHYLYSRVPDGMEILWDATRADVLTAERMARDGIPHPPV